jgi:hypothetical protein
MLPDTAVTLPETATATTSFDPWDAPYFGAATYFSYQAALWYAENPDEATAAQATSNPAAGLPLSFEPWDAPYFGEAVYFSYSPLLPVRHVQPASASLGTDALVPVLSNLQAEQAPGDAAAANQSGEKTVVQSDSASHRKRSWWARLFG